GIFERPKGSGVWWVRYHDERGREHREKVGPKKLAGDVYKKRKTEVRERRFFPKAEEACDAPFGERLADYLARRMSTLRDRARRAIQSVPSGTAATCMKHRSYVARRCADSRPRTSSGTASDDATKALLVRIGDGQGPPRVPSTRSCPSPARSSMTSSRPWKTR